MTIGKIVAGIQAAYHVDKNHRQLSHQNSIDTRLAVPLARFRLFGDRGGAASVLDRDGESVTDDAKREAEEWRTQQVRSPPRRTRHTVRFVVL